MNDFAAQMIKLNILHQHALLLAIDLKLKDVRALVQVNGDFAAGQGHGQDILAVAVDHSRNQTRITKPLGGARAALRPLLHRHLNRLYRHISHLWKI